MNQDPSLTTCFRLRGDVEGAPSSFVIENGDHLVGSDPTADVVIAVRGVSRRHARLRVAAEGMEVTDLGSKNGTQINGRVVSEGLALAGDELRFGPVALRLEPAALDDARLGVLVDPPSSIRGERGKIEETTWMSRSETATGEERLDLLDKVLDRLDGLPEPDLEGVAHLVAAHLGALGAAFVEWPQDGLAVSLAASGVVGIVPPRVALPKPEAGRRWSPLHQEGPTVLEGVVLHKRGGKAGLLVWRAPGDGDDPPERANAELLALVSRLLEAFRPRPLAGETLPAPAREAPLRLPENIVRCESPAMVALYQQISMLHQGKVPVLLIGETGVGKEHLAQALHDSSVRRDGPFVAVNCAAIPSELLEAEMFGIGKGVATGVQARRGKFSEAHGGTLFLDEIGDMPAELQAKLLRALQESEIHPLGRTPETVDVRVVAATNTNLRQRIEDGSFREDLYFRLAGHVLQVPPLRERPEDLPRLVGHFLRHYCRETSKLVKGISLEALRRMSAYPWPGNVRELEHEIRRLAYLCPPHQAIDSEMLSTHIVAPERASPGTEQVPIYPDPGRTETAVDPQESGPRELPEATPRLGEIGLTEHLERLEIRLLRQALRRTAGNQSRAARLLGISRNGLARRLVKHGIEAAEFQL